MTKLESLSQFTSPAAVSGRNISIGTDAAGVMEGGSKEGDYLVAIEAPLKSWTGGAVALHRYTSRST